MKYFSSIFRTLLLSLTVLPTAQSWAASGGNGGGYLGPDLAGEAIPLQLERGISWERLQGAMLTCLVEGHQTQGLVSLAERIVNQLSQSSYSLFTHPAADQFTLEFASEPEVIFQIGRGDGYPGDPESSYLGLSTRGSQFRVTLRGRALVGHPAKQISLVAPEGLPMVRFHSIDDEPLFGELGEIKRNPLLQRVMIHLPKKYGPQVRLINEHTNRTTPVSVNMIEYVECLQSQIQRSAE